jgi:hypothetical protein
MHRDSEFVAPKPNPGTMEDSGGTSYKFHPLFSSIDGDVILGAKDGSVFFRVHSFSLKTASGFFRTMFTLPQKTQSVNSVIHLDEPEDLLERLLRMICGLPLLPINSYDIVDNLLAAIEKYDMPGPLSVIRLLLMTPPLLNEPFRLYSVACRFGWENEAKYASTETLSFNLHSPELRPYLQSLPSTALLNLYELHHSRRERYAMC